MHQSFIKHSGRDIKRGSLAKDYTRFLKLRTNLDVFNVWEMVISHQCVRLLLHLLLANYTHRATWAEGKPHWFPAPQYGGVKMTDALHYLLLQV